ncbi:MAG: DNA methyltransferase, partial [Nodosilinea sp.]
MDRNAVKTFATWARRHLREQATARLDQFGITPTAIAVATPVTGGLTVAGQVLDAADAQDYQQLLTHLEDLQRQEKTLKAAVERLIDEIAYTWFNRLAALRFMEVNGYLGQRVISSSDPNLVDPDLLRDAGSIAELESLPGLTLDTLATWRDQASRAPNPDEALYRRLLGVQCQALSESLPFLFDPQQDYLTLFMPGSLLNQDSIIRRLVNDIPETDWRDSSDSENGVEIIGWLYQFYISERKDEVIGAKSKIAAHDIPAATQLFTPHWIVRYMVENSLGRLWLESHPESGLRAVMKYYLESPPEEAPHPLTPASHALRSTPTGGEGGQEAASAPLSRSGRGAGGEGLPLQPQELTVLDPACGSGHILVYAFDLLFEIYKEQGYRERDIPALILAHNLHGLDIDERAVQLASFAVLMKARAKNPRFFRDPSQIPHLKILTVRSTRPLLNSRQLAVSSEQLAANSEQLAANCEQLADNSEQLTVFSSQQETPLTTDNWQLSTDPPTDNCQLTTENSSGIFSLAELNREDWLPLLEAFR